MAHQIEDFDDQPSYTVIVAPTAAASLPAIGSRIHRAKVKKMLQVLDTVPEIGRVYDPDYPAARPPFEMRVAHAGRYGIYYTVAEDMHEVRVLFIEDQRRDPLNRFFGIYPHEAE